MASCTDKLATNEHLYGIRYSTTVALGARFPFVSPGGSIGNQDFVDGGYFDNTGAGVFHEMLQEIEKRDNIGPYKFEDFAFRLIYLSNSSNAPDFPKEIHPLLNDALEPVLTVLGTYSTQTQINNLRLVNFLSQFTKDTISFELNLYKHKETAHYPMNWVISTYHRKLIDKRGEEVYRGIDTVAGRRFKSIMKLVDFDKQ